MAAKTKRKATPTPSYVSTPSGMVGLMGVKQVQVGLGLISNRMLYNMINRGEFPRPDCHIGKLPRWSVATFNRWCEERVAAAAGP